MNEFAKKILRDALVDADMAVTSQTAWNAKVRKSLAEGELQLADNIARRDGLRQELGFTVRQQDDGAPWDEKPGRVNFTKDGGGYT